MKKWLIAAVSASMVLLGCGGGGDGGDISIQNRTASLQSMRIQTADKTTSIPLGTDPHLTVVGHFSDKTDIDITRGSAGAGKAVTSIQWSSSDTATAEFISAASPDLTTKKKGTVTVYAKDFFSGKTASLTLTITNPVQQKYAVDGLLDNGSISLRTHKWLQAVITRTDGSKETVAATWSSSRPEIATVDPATGEFRAVAPGKVTIFAKHGAQTANLTVTVLQPLAQPVFTLTCNPQNLPVISAETWNAQYAQDPTNATEWLKVDTESCKALPVVALYVPLSEGSNFLFSTLFAAERQADNTFAPGRVYGAGLKKNQELTVGRKDSLKASEFTALYTLKTH